MQGLLRSLAALVRQGNARHADFVGLDVPGRLAKWLLKHAEIGRGGEVVAGSVIELHASRGELAAELGTTRSTLNRALHSLETRGIIVVAANRITVQMPKKLVTYTY